LNTVGFRCFTGCSIENNGESRLLNAFGQPDTLPKPGDPACHREIQANVDVALREDTIQKFNFDEIAAFGHKVLSDVGIYDPVRDECKADFFYFVDTVLNRVCPANPFGVKPFSYIRAKHFRWMHNLLYNKIPAGEDLYDLLRFGEFHLATRNKWHDKKLILMPRAHGKTTGGDVGENMWDLYKNPNERILILSEIRTNAVKFLGMIKDIYMLIRDSRKTPNYIVYDIMGDWVGDMWNEDEIKVKQRTIPSTMPSISTAGMETEVVSQHYTIINGDDPIGPENTTTPEQIDKHCRKLAGLTEVGDYDRNFVSLRRIFGTRWHFSDYYSKVLDELREMFDILKLACWDDKTHEPLFPEKYTTEVLENIRREKLCSPNPEEWANQWLNEPQDVEHALFQRDDFQYYDNIDKVLEGAFVGIFVDTAWTQNKWSDYIAMVPVAVGNYNYRYVLPYDYFQEDNPFIVANHLITLCAPYYNEHRLRIVGVESNATYKALHPIIADRAPWMPLVDMQIENRSKDSRIMAIASLTKYKKLFIRHDMHDLIEQLLRFPRYSRRDLADALAYHLDWQPISSQVPNQPPQKFPTNTELWRRQIREDDEKAEQRRLHG
jgi:hypothetical protein